MDTLFTTSLIGLGILLGAYILTIALYYRWWKVSQQAVIMALQEKDVTERQLDKMLKKIKFYSTGIKYCRQLTFEIPILAPILLVVLFISWVF